MTFTCARCGEQFYGITPEEDVIEEYKRNFPGAPLEEAAHVCDACYKDAVERGLVPERR